MINIATFQITARIGKSARLRRWVFTKDRRSLHVAAQEPDALAVFQINRGIEDHAQLRLWRMPSARLTQDRQEADVK